MINFAFCFRFYVMRAERTEWFDNRDPFSPEILELLELGVFLPLKVKDSENRQIFVIRTAVHDPKKHSQNDVFKVSNRHKNVLKYLIIPVSSNNE